MRIRLERPRGEVPRVDPLSLADNFATVAHQCRLGSGALAAFRGLLPCWKLAKAGPIRTIYRWGAQAGQDAHGYIGSVANTTPVAITVPGRPHRLETGQRVYVSLTGLPGIDGKEWAVTVTGPHAFTLDGSSASGAATTGTWVKLNGYWFHSANRVNYVRGPIPGDTTLRTYYTGEGEPKLTYAPLAVQGGGKGYPLNSYRLGVPAPELGPTASTIDYTAEVQDIALANPLRVRIDGHRLEDGHLVHFTGVGGTTEINDTVQPFTVIKVDANHIDLESVDGTAYGAYTGGGTVTQAPPVESRDYITRAYGITYVSELGEEGPISPLSSLLEVGPNMSVALADMPTGPLSGNFNLKWKRIYRQAMGAGASALQFVDEIPLAQETYTDTKTDVELGEVLVTEDWEPPPADAFGLIEAANGTLILFQGNQIIPCEPYAPYAYPVRYRQTAADDIVGGAAFGTYTMICTASDVQVLSGATPAAYSLSPPLQTGQGCVSAASIVSLGESGALYASPDGLVQVGPGGWHLVTEPWLDRDAWQALRPESLRGYIHDGKYIGFYDNGVKQAGFLLDLDPNGDGFIPIDVYATAGFRDALNDALHLVVGDEIVRWDANELSRLTHRYVSRPWEIAAGYFACAEVLARSYDDLMFRIYDRDALVHEQVVTSRAPLRLPPRLYTRPKVEITGTDTWQRVTIAEAIEELAD